MNNNVHWTNNSRDLIEETLKEHEHLLSLELQSLKDYGDKFKHYIQLTHGRKLYIDHLKYLLNKENTNE